MKDQVLDLTKWQFSRHILSRWNRDENKTQTLLSRNIRSPQGNRAFHLQWLSTGKWPPKVPTQKVYGPQSLCGKFLKEFR